MPIKLEGLDPEKCHQRNRVMALRYGLETAELEVAPPTEMIGKPDFARGRVPGPDQPEEALALINSLRPQGSPELTLQDVHILPVMQSANTNFVGDRYMFLGSSTLRNIQREAAAGFAFMNAHRTGDLSTPSEQPFGRTYAGRYERYPAGMTPDGQSGSMVDQSPPAVEGQDPPRRFERVLLGTYMVRGVHPNGTGGPSTDDMHRQIAGGVMHDVSMGLNGGQKVCDVCGNEVRSEDCTHVPGTSRNMSKEDTARQKGRGVKKGHASYTLEDAHAHEVSGVYDGAVPGAGFSKAVEYIKLGRMGAQELSQIAAAYSELLEVNDIMDNASDAQVSQEQEDSLYNRIARRLGINIGTARTVPTLATMVIAPPVFTDTDDAGPQTDPVLAPLQAQNHEALERRAMDAERRAEELMSRERHSFADRIVEQKLEDGHLLDAGAPAAILLFRWLSDIDAGGEALRDFTTPLGNVVRTSLVALASSVLDEVPQHNLLSDHAIPEDAHIIPSQEVKVDMDLQKAHEDAQVVKNRSERLASKRARKTAK